MRKNLLDPAVAQEIIVRANRLTSESKNKWGQMNPTEMLHHCNRLNRAILKKELPFKKTTLVQHVARFLFLNIIPKFPHNLKIPVEHITKGKIDRQEFETEKAEFIRIMGAFSKRNDLTQTHPAFGNLNAEEWGKVTWMHMDHHLRQFGV